MTVIKTCKIHGDLTIEQVKPRKPKKSHHNISYACKECIIEASKSYYNKNKQRVINNAENWRINNKEKINEIRRKYNNKDERKIIMREYYEKNMDKIKLRTKLHHQKPEQKEKAKLRAPHKMQQRKLKLYGITQLDYDNMMKEQNGVCAICKHPETAYDSRLKLVKKLAIDHCHNTGKVRGLLCGKCNLTLGRMKECIQSLEAMIQYIINNNN